MLQITDVDQFIAKYLREDSELYVKMREMMQYVVDNTVEELGDVKYKYTHPEKLKDEAIKAIIAEQGFDYIVNVMNTIDGLEFNTMLSFMDLINQLKGTRKGLELVLKLLGFDSIIKEWWEVGSKHNPWEYEIIVIVNSSLVPDIFDTIDKVKAFSRNYVLAKIANINVRFSASKFAERGVIMGGFAKPVYIGNIVQRANI